MNIKALFEYYKFGHNYSLLRKGKPKNAISEVIVGIDEYLTFIKEHDLKVTLKAVEKELTEFRNILKNQPMGETISSSNTQKLSTIIESADKTLDSELKLRDAHILTEKRLGIQHLLGNIESLFSKGVYSKLPNISKYDFSEAGKCIAFERPTAAAFHILRGCEGTLKFHYLSVVKRNRVQPCTWGPMIEQLRTKRNIPKPLLDVLDNIRVNFRNPTSHPESTYTLDEVQDLFNLCIDAVNRLVIDHTKKNS